MSAYYVVERKGVSDKGTEVNMRVDIRMLASATSIEMADTMLSTEPYEMIVREGGDDSPIQWGEWVLRKIDE